MGSLSFLPFFPREIFFPLSQDPLPFVVAIQMKAVSRADTLVSVSV